MKPDANAGTALAAPVTSDMPVLAKPLGRRSPKQGGFGALEVMIAIVVGIFAVIAAVAWNSKLTNTSNNNQELQNVSSLLTSAHQTKTQSGYGPSGTDLIPVLIASDAIPENMPKGGGTVTNLWGGPVTIVSTGSGHTLSYGGVPNSNCIFLSTMSANSNATGIRINGGATITGEVTAVAATAACTNGSNTLAWSAR